MNIFPIPVNTPLIDSQNKQSLSYPWLQFLKTVGDYAVTSSVLKNSSNNNFKYVLNGNLCICNYYVQTAGTSDLTIDLPYTSLCAFECLSVVYPPNSTKITIPSGITFTQFEYIAKI